MLRFIPLIVVGWIACGMAGQVLAVYIHGVQTNLERGLNVALGLVTLLSAIRPAIRVSRGKYLRFVVVALNAEYHFGQGQTIWGRKRVRTRASGFAAIKSYREQQPRAQSADARQ